MGINAYTALILAGGQGSRLGGQDKGLLCINGHYLIKKTIDRLAEQTQPPSTILISANRHFLEYQRYGYPVLPDSLPGFLGPLAGILTALQQPLAHSLLVVPCDMPNLPIDFAQVMLNQLHAATHYQAISARDPTHWYPVLLALRPNLQISLTNYLHQGGRSIRGWLATLSHYIQSFDTTWENLNTPEDLANTTPHKEKFSTQNH